MSDGPPAVANRAVFLSYAREDTDAARRVADALRAFGIEVWFDQAELRGGDQWDAKIKKQIRDCTLFLPFVSQQTQARAEGYFRREWLHAVERTRDMSAGVAFIVPVVIDDTREADADVPEEFMRYQWTRLAHGVPSPQFVEQIKRLLETPRRGGSQNSGARTQESGVRSQESGDRAKTVEGASSNIPAVGRTRPAWVPYAAIAGVVVLVMAGVILSRRDDPAARRSAPPTAEKSTPPPAAQPPPDLANAKSVAVLPFTNMSDDKDASAFFSDGIHEDILTSLSNIRALRVVSRTSVLQYRATTKPMRQIAQELGVTYILEGSVRRAGNRVRVTGQLIRAATDEHIWAQNFDRDLTDIFAIQAELAQAIAGELKAAISPEEKSLVERRPTQNVAAYELVLKAREIRKQDPGTSWQQQEQLLLAALKLDPNYATAYADLTYAYGWANLVGGQGLNPENRKKAKAAIDAAVRLAPDSLDVVRGLGDYYYFMELDYGRALEQYEKLARLRPNDPDLLNRLGAIQRRQGRWAESLATWRKLEELDPADMRNTRDILIMLAIFRRWDEAGAQARKLVRLRPGYLTAEYELAYLAYLAAGSTEPSTEFFGRLTPVQLKSPQVVGWQKFWAVRHGDLDEAVRLDRGSAPGESNALDMALVLAARGDREAARARLGQYPEQLRARLVKDDTDVTAWSNLGVIEALVGQKDEALRCARKAVEIMPVTRDAMRGGLLRAQLAVVYAWTGDKAAAIAEVARALEGGSGSFFGTGGALPESSVHVLKHDPRFAPLHGDPRWEALLNDPKNNAPWF